MPRAALLSIHARVEGTKPTALQDPSLLQLWGPRFSAYVVAARDLAVFTLGRLPEGGAQRELAEDLAMRIEAFLGGGRMTYEEVGRGLGEHPNRLRYAAPTGTVVMHWDGARQAVIWSVPRPRVDPKAARLELARRYLHVFGPATPPAFAQWAGFSPREGVGAFEALGDALLPARTPIGDAWILAADESAFRATAGSPATARLLPSGDAYFLLQGSDRELLVPDAPRRASLWTSRVWPGAVLVKGEMAGTWRRAGAMLTIEPWGRLPAAAREAVEAEAQIPAPADRRADPRALDRLTAASAPERIRAVGDLQRGRRSASPAPEAIPAPPVAPEALVGWADRRRGAGRPGPGGLIVRLTVSNGVHADRSRERQRRRVRGRVGRALHPSVGRHDPDPDGIRWIGQRVGRDHSRRRVHPHQRARGRTGRRRGQRVGPVQRRHDHGRRRSSARTRSPTWRSSKRRTARRGGRSIGIGSSAGVKVGQPVVALGAPLGLSSTVTAGIVSALDRYVPVPAGNGQTAHLIDALQTDASINPGNSGGALVDCAGDMVGINTAISTVPNAAGHGGGGSVGIGFAIPVDLAMPLAGQLISTGSANHPTFGLQAQTIPQSPGAPTGLFVTAVDPGGPADKAGIQPGDVITEVDGQKATSVAALEVATLRRSAGDTVSITYERDGAPTTVDVTLAAQ